MKKTPTPRSLTFPITILILIGMTSLVMGCATPAASAVIPIIHAPSFAFAQIAKPTPIPTIQPTATALPTTDSAPAVIESTPTTESVITAQIVEDASVTTYPEAATQPIEVSAPGYGGNKYILVDISEQHMYVYEGDTLVYSFVASTGMNNATRTGSFSVLDKIPNAYGATWDIWMPEWLGIYWAGSLENGIHALPILSNGATLWEGYLGTPISFGCVVLGTYEAQLLFNWADVGTPVDIQW